jgi:hypothetical protein
LWTTEHYTHLTTKDLQETIKRHPVVRKSTSPFEIINSLIRCINQFELEKDNRFDVKIITENNALELRVEINRSSDNR